MPIPGYLKLISNNITAYVCVKTVFQMLSRGYFF